MTDGKDDYQHLMNQKRFLGEIEQVIRSVNRERIHENIPLIDKEKIISLAKVVGYLRARYLESAFRLGLDADNPIPDKPTIEEMKSRRLNYEEARMAFESLREAIEKGYVDVDGI